MSNITVGATGDFTTIQDAINAAHAGDTIVIASGTYNENLTIDKGLIFQGANDGIDAGGARGAETIIHWTSGNAVTVNTTDAVTFDGLSFTGTHVIVASTPNTDVTFTNSVFTLQSAGNNNNNFYFNQPDSVTFTHNSVDATGYSGALFQPVGDAADPSHTTVTFTDNTFTGVSGTYVSGDDNKVPVILNLSDVNGTVSGNTFNNVDIGVLVANGTGPLEIDNNTFEHMHRQAGATDGGSAAGVVFYQPDYNGKIDIHDNAFSDSDAGVRTSGVPNTTVGGEYISIDHNTFTDVNAPGLQSSVVGGALHLTNSTVNGTPVAEQSLSSHIINVDQSGVGGAYTTIQDAINHASAGDTIMVAAGTYHENLNVNQSVTIIGSGDSTIIDGSFRTDNGNFTGSLADWLKTAPPGVHLSSGSGISINANNVTIEGLQVSDFTFGVSLGTSADIDQTLLQDVTLTSNLYGVDKSTTSDINHFTMVGGSVSDGYGGVEFDKSTSSATDGLANNVIIDGTDFSHLDRKGIYAETLSNAHLTNITMDDVGQFGGTPSSGPAGAGGNGIDLNLKNGAYSNIEIDNFHLTDTGASDKDGANAVGDKNGGAIVIEARDQGSPYAGAPASYTGTVNVHDGVIDGHTSTGIQAGEPGQTNAGPAVTITNVSISGAEQTGTPDAVHGDITNVTQSTMTVNGTAGDDNYTVSAGSTGDIVFNGGGGNDSFTGGAEHDTATYSTTLSASSFSSSGGHWNVSAGAEGTDHLTNVEEVTDGAGHHILLVGNGGYATIQAAIDAAHNGDIIEVAAGTYAENLNINKAVTIDGAHAGDAGTDGDRDITGASGETTIIGHSKITATDGAVTIDGVVFINDSTTTHGGAGNPTLQITSGEDHVVTNSIFYSTAVGGANGVLDRAISLPGIADGDITISDNYFTGSHASAFGGASWGTAVWSDGGGAQLDITGNTFENVRTGLNLNLDGTSQDNVDGNTFHTAGSGISVGPTDNDQLTVGDNTFHSVGDEFNFRNVPTDVTFDAETHVETVVTDGTSNDVVSVLGGGGNDTLSGTEGSDFIDGNNLSSSHVDNDVINGRGGDDLLMGEAGDDSITGGAGNDTISGGTGKDTAHYSGTLTASEITYDSGTGSWVINNSNNGDGTDHLTGVEKVTDGTHSFILVGGGSEYTTTAQGVAAATNGETVITAPSTPTTPTDTNAAGNSVDEDAPQGTLVGITAHSTDLFGAVTYTLSADSSNGGFTIDSATGVVSVNDGTKIDFESSNQYSITVTATNGTGATSTAAFSIDVNNLPPSLKASLGDVAEGTVAVGSVVAPGSDTSGVSYVVFGSADGNLFQVDAQGNLSFKAAPDFENPTDSGHTGTYTVSVGAADSSGAIATNTYHIHVTDVAPSEPTDSNATANAGGIDGSVVEGAVAGTLVGITASSSDPVGGTVTYILTDDAGGRFAIDPSTGAVTIADPSLIDFETSSSHSITVSASDGTLSSSSIFTIAVTDAPPSAPADGDATTNFVSEDAVDGTSVGITAVSADPNGGDVTYSLSNDPSGTFTIDSTSGVVTIADSTQLDAEAGLTRTITVEATDANGVSSTTDFTIAIGDVNDNPPVISSIATASEVENTAATHVVYQASASDADATAANNTITYSITGDDATQFSIDSSSGAVRFLASPDHEAPTDLDDDNNYQVTVHANDGVHDTTEDVTITVSDAIGNTIHGGSGSDTIDGQNAPNGIGTSDGTQVATDENDIITGGAGNDTISGLGGDDQIDGGAGNDTLNGDDNNDTLTGGAGVDNLHGGAGNDTLVISGTGDQKDTLAGDAGTDTVQVAGTTDVTLAGFDGVADSIEKWTGNGHGLLGTSAADTFDFTGVTVSATVGHELAFIDGGAGNDTITAGDGYDYDLRGGAGNDVITGGDGDDVINGGKGADSLDGGTGTDTVSYAGSTAGVVVNLRTLSASGGDAAGDHLANFANVIGSSFNDTLIAAIGGSTLTGGAGLDNINGGAGNDTIMISGTGDQSDIIDGNTGTDTIAVSGTGAVTLANFNGVDQGIEVWQGHNADLLGTAQANTFDFRSVDVSDLNSINAGAGNDIIFASDDGLTLIGGAGVDTVTGGAGNDTVEVSGSNDSTDVLAGGGGTDTIKVLGTAALTLANFDSNSQSFESWEGGTSHELVGTSAANTFDLSALASVTGLMIVDGGAGNDAITGTDATALDLRGGTGNDMLTAGDAGDTLTGGAGVDVVTGGAGNDTIIVSGSTDSTDDISGGGGTDTIKIAGTTALTLTNFDATAQSIEVWTGNNHQLVGTSVDNTFDLSGLASETGLTFVDGGAGNDSLNGNDAFSLDLRGNTGDDALTAGDFGDRLTGGAGTDTVTGGAGNDTIIVSGALDSTDSISGGGGIDTLLVAGTAALTLTDFDAAAQAIEIWHGNGHELIGTTADNTFDLSGLTAVTGLTFIDGGAGNDTITGSDSASLNLRGGAGDDTLTAGDHGDVLTGAAGNDHLIGGAGNDTFVIAGSNDINDTFDGHGGVNTIKASGAVTLAGFDATTDNIQTWTGTVSAGVTGTAGDDTFDLHGLTTVKNLAFVDGGAGNDTIIGSDHWAGNLRGGAGDDMLTGGAMNDKFTGGAGVDTFVVLDGGAHDSITDFTFESKTVENTAVDDKIDVSDFGFADYADLTSHMTNVGKNVVIDFHHDGVDTLTIANTTVTILHDHQSDFII